MIADNITTDDQLIWIMSNKIVIDANVKVN